MRPVPLAAIGLIAAFISGCQDSAPKLYPVQGRVTVDGNKPLKYGILNLYGEDAASAKFAPIAYVKDGEYTILTDGKPGAPPGKYVVTIQAGATGGDEKNPYVTEWYADGKYTSRETSGLTMEVVEKPQPGQYDFQLKPHVPGKK